MTDHLLAFGAMFLIELMFAVYVITTAERRPVLAAICAAGIFGIQAVLIRGYVSQPNLVWSATAGAFAGTWCMIRWYIHRARR